jgi:hypothetical protein
MYYRAWGAVITLGSLIGLVFWLGYNVAAFR